MSPILLRLNACVQCVGCLQSNMCYDSEHVMGRQPIKGDHSHVMSDGLWTVLYSIAQSSTFLGGCPTHFAHSLHLFGARC